MRPWVLLLVLAALWSAVRLGGLAQPTQSGRSGEQHPRTTDQAWGQGNTGTKRRPSSAAQARGGDYASTARRPALASQRRGRAYANTPGEIVPYRRLVHPYKYFFVTPLQFLGAGREVPEPKVTSVKIGWLGPLEGMADGAFGKQMLQGTRLAVEQANAAGGYHGIPFALAVHEDKARWGDSSNALVKMFFDEKVWGIIGTMGSANAHVMMRATLKMNIAVVNTATTDPTLMEHRIPFNVRCIPDDRQNCYALAWHLFKERGFRWVSMIRANNREGRFGVREFVDAARRLGHPLLVEVRFDEGETDFTPQLERIRKSGAEAVVVWGNPRESALIVKQMRQMGMKQAVAGWFRMGFPEFLEIAGEAAEGAVFCYPYDPTANDPVLKQFQRRYQKRFGVAPDLYAAHAYDGANLLIAAIRKAGLNRIRISDAVTGFKHFRGVTGEITFDAALNDVGPIYLGTVEGGRFRFRPARLSG